MISEPRNLLNPFEILAIVSVCGVLFMAAHRRSRPCSVDYPRNDLVYRCRADVPLRPAL